MPLHIAGQGASKKKFKEPSKKQKFFYLFICIFFFGFLIFSVYFFVFIKIEKDEAILFSARKTRDIGAVSIALSDFANDFSTNGYPAVPEITEDGGCAPLLVLKPYIEDRIKRLNDFSFDRAYYFYCVDDFENPQSYILGAKGMYLDSFELEGDLDGNAGYPFLINSNEINKCGDPLRDTVFCVYNGYYDSL